MVKLLHIHIYIHTKKILENKESGFTWDYFVEKKKDLL